MFNSSADEYEFSIIGAPSLIQAHAYSTACRVVFIGANGEISYYGFYYGTIDILFNSISIDAMDDVEIQTKFIPLAFIVTCF